MDRYEERQLHRDRIQRTIIGNAEAGLRQAGLEVSQAEAQRAELWHTVRQFMDAHEFILTPVNPVPPFSAEQETLTEIGGGRWTPTWIGV